MDNVKKDEPKVAEEVRLTKDELVLISNVLYNNRWNGQEFEGTIKPLINKLAQLIDQLK